MATLTGFNHAPSLVLFVSVLGSMLGPALGTAKNGGRHYPHSWVQAT